MPFWLLLLQTLEGTHRYWRRIAWTGSYRLWPRRHCKSSTQLPCLNDTRHSLFFCSTITFIQIANPSVATLYEDALVYETGSAITSTGALTAFSGAKTGRSPLDKRIVKEATSGNEVWWGPVNRPMSPEVSGGSFIILFKCLLSFVTWKSRVENSSWLFMAECHVVWHANRTSAPQNVKPYSYPPLLSFDLVQITAAGTCLAIASLTAFLYMTT